jgi:hypothetical protein
MLTRLKKVWRMFRGQEEYSLTVEESKVLKLWDKIMIENDTTLSESDLCDVMKSLAAKLMKQHDYD